MSDTPAPDVHVRLDTHRTHPSAVVATITGTDQHIAQAHLSVRGFDHVNERTLVMARIDHEEPYWAERASQDLTAVNISVTITPGLREAIDDDWTWANYPYPWCNRQDIRQVSNEAQKIYDDIRHGRLVIHSHAHDPHTIVAVGSYRDGSSVTLHGENHLRTVEQTFHTAAEARAAFHHQHGEAVRPGPAPATDTERQAEQARRPLHSPALTESAPRPEPETVPVYLADAGDHDVLLDRFLDAHGEFEKVRTWSDDTTHAIHELQTLRIERVHETQARETAWTVAAYETPVSDRIWVLTATGATPAPVMQNLLIHLADGDGWDTVIGAPMDEKTVTAAAQPLSDAGWKHTLEGRWIRWTSPDRDAGVQFDAFAARHASQNLATWTIWAGRGPDRPTWAITASPHTPSSLLASLAETLAHQTGTRQAQPASRERRTNLASSPPVAPADITGPVVGRSR
ncbi:DUF317 domain-containing protein [Streptomyces olivaceus]|uniref:DUF317 domain-containing protein n=1 Tax=Streptomyces olivaceus TaxID=47716 RepID=UPI0036742DF4